MTHKQYIDIPNTVKHYMDMVKMIGRTMDHSLWMSYSEFLNKGMLNKCEKLRLYAYDLTNDNGGCVELTSII